MIPVVAEVFRAHGYEGATLSVITEATGLGKGSLYHFFPGGKEELAAAVLADLRKLTGRGLRAYTNHSE